MNEELILRLSDPACPLAYMQCSYEKYPKLLYANQKMMDILEISDLEECQILEFMKENIYFFLPSDERDKYTAYLDLVTKNKFITISHKVITVNNTVITLNGYMGVLIQNDDIFFYMIYSNHNGAELSTIDSIFTVLESAYNIIFEVNTVSQTVSCIHGDKTSDIGKLFSAEMTVSSAIDFWTHNYIVKEDQKRASTFLKKIQAHDFHSSDVKTLQEEFRVLWDDNVIYSFICNAFSFRKDHILVCCRDTEKVQFSGTKAREVRSLKKLHTYFDKISTADSNVLASIIFELNDNGICNIIYASQTFFSMMHWRYDQYFHYIDEGIPLNSIRKKVQEVLGTDIHMRLLNGETVYAHVAPYHEQISISCTEKISGIYEIVAKTESLPVPESIPKSGIYVRTFGFFDIFVNGIAISFTNEKEKELLALLIDRNGGILTFSTAAPLLWEGDTISNNLKAKFRKLIFSLKSTLAKNGLSHILVSNNGAHCIDVSAVTCDYYEMINGNPRYKKTFHNTYMADYSWGEYTLAKLWEFDGNEEL